MRKLMMTFFILASGLSAPAFAIKKADVEKVCKQAGMVGNELKSCMKEKMREARQKKKKKNK